MQGESGGLSGFGRGPLAYAGKRGLPCRIFINHFRNAVKLARVQNKLKDLEADPERECELTCFEACLVPMTAVKHWWDKEETQGKIASRTTTANPGIEVALMLLLEEFGTPSSLEVS